MIVASPQKSRFDHDAEVAARFDATETRFKPKVAANDVRLEGLIRAIGPVAGQRILDLGWGSETSAGCFDLEVASRWSTRTSWPSMHDAPGLPPF